MCSFAPLGCVLESLKILVSAGSPASVRAQNVPSSIAEKAIQKTRSARCDLLE